MGKLGIQSALDAILTGKFLSQKIVTERIAEKLEKNQERFKNDIKLPLKAS